MKCLPVVVLLAACAGEAVPNDPALVETANGLYSMHLIPDPHPFVAGSEVTLGMHVHDEAHEEGLPGLTVEVTPFMPDMGHGMSGKVPVTEGESGLYTAAMTFGMAGYWELTIDVDGVNGSDSAVVGYDVE